MKNFIKSCGNSILSILIIAFIAVMPGIAKAHCDTMDGPVVRDARKALESGNINMVLIWVQEDDEGEISDAFERTLAVRNLSPEAKALADQYFFETLVRVHRAGEGAPYTGLKPAGTVVDPALIAAEKAIEDGSINQLIDHLKESVSEGVRKHFAMLQARQNYDNDDVNGGREYVKSYVSFIHYVERLFTDAEAAETEHGH
jgi:hypothetical protein